MIYRNLKGYEDYYLISECGDVLSKERKSQRKLKQGIVDIVIKPKQLKSSRITKNNRYKHIELTIDGISKTELIHRLVYLTFVGDIQSDRVINHIDLNRENNHYSNLEQIKQVENINHYFVNKKNLLITQGKKICKRCEIIKSVDDFYDCPKAKNNKISINRKRHLCKNCFNEK
jgi:hypothetical protein